MRALCLGNNTEDTDHRARYLARERHLECHGLLTELSDTLRQEQYQQPGLYHTSVYDIAFGRLVEIMDQFNHVIILDQPKQEWSHPDAYLMTLRAAKATKSTVEYLDPSVVERVDFWHELVQNNKSFCIFPFIELLAHSNHSTVCCRSNRPVARIQDIGNWQTNPHYRDIRQKMIAGELLPEHCGSCYRLEQQGVISARQQETVEWANRLNLKSIDDLSTVCTPAYFEIRASNKCNLQCRMCTPALSHLIDDEYRRLGWQSGPPTRSFDYGFDIIDFTNLMKLYVAGGEPLIMPAFYTFLDKCIEEKKVDFELLINTNGTKLSDKFKTQIAHFKNLQFIFSIDALGELNHYIRWPSDWKTVIDNLSYLIDHGHKCAINTTVSIYNVARLDELFAFLDSKFPNILIHIGLVESPTVVNPWLYPENERVVTSMQKVQTLPCYRNDKLFASAIDGILNYFKAPKKSLHDLKPFFAFNDKLDRSRSIALADYLPELSAYRAITFD